MIYKRSFKKTIDGYNSFACCHYKNKGCNPLGMPFRPISLNVSFQKQKSSFFLHPLRHVLYKRSIFLMMVSKHINIHLKSLAIQAQVLLFMALSTIYMLNALIQTEMLKKLPWFVLMVAELKIYINKNFKDTEYIA